MVEVENRGGPDRLKAALEHGPETPPAIREHTTGTAVGSERQVMLARNRCPLTEPKAYEKSA